MLIPLLGLVTGILASLAGASWPVALVAGIAAVVFSLLLRRASRQPLRAFRLNKWNYAWIFLAFFAAGVIDADLQRPFRFGDESEMRRVVAVTGNVKSIRNSNSGDIAELEVYQLIEKDGRRYPPADNLTMILRSDALTCRVGDDILVPSPVGAITDSPNYFESGYSRRLNRRGLYYQAECESGRIVVLGHRDSPGAFAWQMRERLESVIENTRLSKPTQNLLITILLGDRAYLEPDTRNLFADAGISHMLALSGMHAGIIAGILLWLLFPLNFAGMYRWRLVVASLFLLFYAFITGLAPSIVRATMMSFAMLAAMLLERKNSAWNSLLLATFIILVFSPLALFDVGLQLSFLCVTSLLFFVNPLNPIDHKVHPRLYAVSAFLLTSIVATLGTWCVTAWYFGKLPLMFLPANIVALPLLPLYLTFALVYLLLATMGIEWAFAAKVLDWCPDALQRALHWLAGEGATIDFSPSAWTVAAWLVLAALLAVVLRGGANRWPRYAAVAASLAVIGSVAADASRNEEEAFIVQQRYHDIVILHRVGREDRMLKVPRYAISAYEAAGLRIVAVDCSTQSIADSAGKHIGECDLLLLGGGIKEPLPEIARKVKPKKILIHPSVNRKREAEIMHDADSLSLPIHSIRINGPYRHH